MPKETAAKKPRGKSRPERFTHPAWRIGRIFGITVLFFFALALAGFATLAQAYAEKVYPGVALGSLDVAGKTAEEVRAQLTEYSDTLAANGVTFTHNGKTVALSPVLLPEGNLDFAYEMFSIDVDTSVTTALAVGRTGNVLGRQIALADALLTRESVPLTYAFDRAYMLTALTNEFSAQLTPATDAEFSRNDRGALVVVPEKDGVTLSFDAALTLLERDIASGVVPEPIALQEVTAHPTVTAAGLEAVRSQAEAALARDGLTLTGPDEHTWQLTADDIAPLLSTDGKGGLALHTPNATAFLESIAQDVVVEPKNGKFTRDGNKVVEFQVAEPGRRLDVDATRATLAKLLFTDMREGAVSLAEVQPDVTSNEIAQLGLQDLIGVGHSNFKGSPTNRRYNIGVGAAAVNGTLIAPGEEFSLVKTLGRIDGTTGYRQELVIKGDKTIPEYGGGLCQIGTTTFRGALASGLPITARKNHSYVVSYYNDENGLPGTDATIYDPAPDMRFLNDTGHYILIQTRIEGDDLYFDFWGTNDGRVAQQTKPVVSNRVSPPATKYVETTDLAPGVEKCTEKAHAGMDAQFTYTVQYPSGEVKEEVFQSHYRPWQAVCLRGVAPEEKVEPPKEN